MVTIDDLKESLRAQLAMLIDLHEAESSAARAGLCACETITPGLRPPEAASSLPVPDEPSDGEVATAAAIEQCLRGFAAAIAAAEAADKAASDAQGAAAGLLQRAADGRAVALMMRRDAEQRLRAIALGRVVPAIETHRLAEAQAAARLSAVLSRESDARASMACRQAREAARCALTALAAAARADPARTPDGFDPVRTGVATAEAEAAATRAMALAHACAAPSSAPPALRAGTP